VAVVLDTLFFAATRAATLSVLSAGATAVVSLAQLSFEFWCFNPLER